MGLGRKKQAMAPRARSGAEYLLAFASNAAERKEPFAGAFHLMLSSAIQQSGHPLYRDAIATRPMRPHEEVPASIVSQAVCAALVNGDRQGAMEALEMGLEMLAKWPVYLDGGVVQHPDLTLRA